LLRGRGWKTKGLDFGGFGAQTETTPVLGLRLCRAHHFGRRHSAAAAVVAAVAVALLFVVFIHLFPAAVVLLVVLVALAPRVCAGLLFSVRSFVRRHGARGIALDYFSSLPVLLLFLLLVVLVRSWENARALFLVGGRRRRRASGSL
jgi:uncharacterized membrane protein